MRASTRRPELIGLVALAVVATGCATGSEAPLDLMEEIPPTTVRVSGPPLDPILVELRTDKRPLHEHGFRKYLGRSYLGDSRLLEPTYVVILRALARGLLESGATTSASLRDLGQPLRLGVVLEHGSASFGEGLENLVLVLPTSGLTAEVELRLVLEDRVGRVFLDRRLRTEREGSAVPLAGLEGAAADLLGRAIRDLVDRALPAIHGAPGTFWERLRRERGGAVTPPESRSSTAR